MPSLCEQESRLTPGPIFLYARATIGDFRQELATRVLPI